LLAILSAIPGFGVAVTLEYLLPVTGVNGEGTFGIGDQLFDVPEVIYAVAVGSKSVGYGDLFVNPHKYAAGAYTAKPGYHG